MFQLLTQDKDFFPTSLPDKFLAIKNIGFDGIEIDGKLLIDRFDEVQQAMTQTGLPVVTACGGYRGWIGDFDVTKRQQCIQDISVILERLAKLGGKGIVVPAAWGMFSLRLPPMIPPRSAADDETALLDSLRQLDAIAKRLGQTVFLEPLNRYEDHMINTVAKAREYIEKGRFAHVKIIADCYHMNIEEASTLQTLESHRDAIGHIHFADNHRFEPGNGQINFGAILKKLGELSYTGAIAFECRVAGTPALEAYKASVRHIRGLMSE